MDFFPGFSWAIPKAFSDAIANCRFEEGDVIYDSESAYQEWGKAVKLLGHCIKVNSPRRTTSVTIGEKKSVVKTNWKSEVAIELIGFSNEPFNRKIVTTQGRLFVLLWKGDLEVLDVKKPNPPTPIFLQDVKKKLEETIPVCNKIADNKSYFTMAYDPTNEVSRKKHLKVLDALNREYEYRFYQLSAKESGFRHWDDIFPVISTNIYVIEQAEYKEIEKALKKVLYTPSKGAKKGQFNLRTHGILESHKGQ